MIPRIPMRRFRFRYSLRTAGVLVTLFCIWLGWHANRARHQRIAVEQLHSIRATVVYDRQVGELYVPSWIRTKIGDDFFLNVVEVRLHDYRVGRQSLPLPPSQIDLAVDAMRYLPRLRQVTFNHTQIRDEDLQRFAPLASQVESLYFNEFHGRLTGDGIRYLARWPRLRELTVHGNSLNKASLKYLVDLPALEVFGWGRGNLDETAFAALSQCKQLERLQIFMCWFEGISLAKLQSAKRLKAVTLHNCGPQSAWPGGLLVGDPSSPLPNYQFRPIDEFSEDVLHDPDKQYRKYHDWLDKILPGVKISEFSSS
jgi:hypothetical protein